MLTLIGKWPTAGYTFEASLGVEEDYFLGLALDYNNDYRVCQEQIQQWSALVAQELGFPALVPA